MNFVRFNLPVDGLVDFAAREEKSFVHSACTNLTLLEHKVRKVLVTLGPFNVDLWWILSLRRVFCVTFKSN